MDRNEDRRQPTRLCLFAPPAAEAGAEEALDAAMAAGDVACVVIDAAGAQKERVVALVKLAQARGAAALLRSDTQLAGRVGADGVHLDWKADDVAAALKSFKPDGIVGVGRIASRDDAMEAGESGVDYVAFGDPGADGGGPPATSTSDRAGWWAGTFVVPCVAFAADAEQAEALARLGVEFVARGASLFADPRGPAAATAQTLEALARAAATVAP